MKVFGILGDERVFRSKSPIMHNAVMRRRGFAGAYVPLAVQPERVGDAVRGIQALGMAGVNVTVPHKEAVAPFLDDLSEEASSIGAVNTIVRLGDALYGHNTDVGGFKDALQQVGFQTANAKALVFGAGGAARAVLQTLHTLNAGEVLLTGRNAQQVHRLAGFLDAEAISLEQIPHIAPAVDLLVNATAVSSPDESPQLAELVESLPLPRCALVFDINYGRDQNFWERLAMANKVKFIDGILMLAHQARRSFELWTGIDAGAEEFLEALGGER